MSDKRQEYIEQRDNFKRKKAGLLEEMAEHEREILVLKKRIRDTRPRTEHGKYICNYCDCISSMYMGETPSGGLSGGDPIYECEICGGSKTC